MKRLESSIEKEVVETLRSLGFWVLKIKTEGRRGTPDLMVALDGLAMFVELKAVGGKLSKNQIAMRKELLEHGMSVIVGCDPHQVCKAVCRRFTYKCEAIK